ncbi:MAG: hypothetical protein ACI8PZ_005136 [Myxococcota bacterium]
MPTTWRLRWEAPGDRHWVEYGREDPLEGRTAVRATPGGLVRLPAGEWIVRAVSEGSGGRREGPVLDVHVPPPPPNLGAFQVVQSRPEAEMNDLLLLFNQYDMTDRWSWVAVVDGRGEHRWYLPGPPAPWKINRAQVGPEGDPWYATYHWDREVDWGTLHHVGWDGDSAGLWSLPEQHHDFVVEPGAVHWLSWVYRDEPMPGTDAAVATDAVRRRALDGGEAEVLWSVLDGWVEPYTPCSHARDPKFRPGFLEFTHGNSLVAVGDEWWVMLRYLDQLIAIDRDTGEVNWALGGPGADVVFEGEPFSHPHFSEGWPGGLLVFDNGSHRADPVSRAVEYALEDGVAREVWSFAHPDGEHVPFLGDVRSLPGGNRLVVWSSLGALMEVTPDGSVVWEAHTTDVVGRVTVLPAQ